MQLVRRGQAPAFEVIYERHSQAAFSLAYRMAGSRGVAEDVVQEAFLNIWRSGARYERTRGSVRTWVLGIVHHRAIDALRRSFVHERRRASDEGIEERLETGERTDVEAARHEEAATVRAALDHLPSEQSQVIELAYFGGFTHTEIADDARDPGRHREGPDAARAGEDAPRARRRAGEPRMSTPAPDHERWADAVGSYLLGALPPEEREGFEAHLDGLPGVPARRRGAARSPPTRCRSRSRRSPRRPALKDRIMAVVESEAELLAAAGEHADGPRRAPAPARARAAASSAAGCCGRASRSRARAVLLVAGGRRAARCWRAAARTPARSSPSTPAPGANVRLEIGDDGSTLVARNMPAPPPRPHLPGLAQAPGAATPSRRRCCGPPRRDGSAEVAVPGSLDGVEAVLVTDEPQGGSDVPSKPPVITAATA